MAEMHGVAGEWARIKGMIIGLWPLLICVFLAGFAVAIGMLGSIMGAAILLSIVIVGLAFALNHAIHLIERYFKGARGEERVAHILECLPSSYHVFNDFNAMGTQVDHVVIGPNGVYSVETKCWGEEVSIEGSALLVGGVPPSRSPIQQSLEEAELVSQVLTEKGWSGKITPVLAFASDTFMAHLAEVAGVVVINSCEMSNAFLTGRVTMSTHEIERLVRLLES